MVIEPIPRATTPRKNLGESFPMSRCLAALAFLTTIVTLIATAPSHAANQFYLGDWKIDSAVEAPWARPKISPSEKNRLMGKTVTLKAKEIAGPQPLACKGATYKVTDYSADMLFQGAFEDMHDTNKAVDPQKLAESLGFSGKTFQTLETGCEIDWHFVDPTTAKVGLNDFVYTLKKQ
jgi:hypothetical protein